jgi:serine/threonine protein phosphatase 1
MKEVYETSKYGSYRFVLGELGEKPPLIFFGINPSTATPENYDQTIRRVKAISNAKQRDSWIMLNVYPQIATKPKDLHKECNSEKLEENIEVIKEFVKDGSTVVAAWGNLINKRKYLIDCLKRIVGELNGIDIIWKHLGAFTIRGNPKHPLFLPKNVKLNDFDIKNYMSKK